MVKKTSKELIVEAAAKMLSENPNASLMQIAKAAGVGRATVYRHYESREEIIRELILDCLKLSDELIYKASDSKHNSKEKLTAIVEALIPVGSKYYFLLSLPEDYSEEAGHIVVRQEQQLKQLIQELKQEEFISSRHQDEWIALLINSMIYTSWQAVEEGVLPAKMAAAMSVDAFLNGVT